MGQRGEEGSVVAVHVHQRRGYTGNNWSHGNGNKRLKKNLGSHTMKTFNRLTTKES
jgi:hypothetical protein